MQKKIEIIEAASELGAGKPGASKGPAALLQILQQRKPDFVQQSGFYKVADKNDAPRRENTSFAKEIEYLDEALHAVAKSTEKSLKKGFFPVILSGDHSNAIGSVSGFKNHFAHKNIGVIWVDAHLDLHSPFTTPSGNLHGMALNALLGNDNLGNKKNEPSDGDLKHWEALKHLGSLSISPKVLAENIVFIGVRDYEPEELALVEDLGISVIRPETIHNDGIAECLKLTLDLLEDCDKIYVSFDVDSLDPSISAGTGTPVPGGLTMEEAEIIFKTLFHHPKVAAFEITEINPELENDNQMARAVASLLDSVL